MKEIKKQKVTLFVLLVVSTLMIVSVADAGFSIRLEKDVPVSEGVPTNITFNIYTSETAPTHVATQTFSIADFRADFYSLIIDAPYVGNSLRFKADFTNTDDLTKDMELWYEIELDGDVKGARERIKQEVWALFSEESAVADMANDIVNNAITASKIADGAVTDQKILGPISSENIEEADPVYSGSPASGIIVNDITNWDTAFGWGDHSLGGYDTTNDSWSGTGDVYTISGNVGIGIEIPTEKLTVAGTIESTSGGIKFPDGTTQVTTSYTALCDLYALTGNIKPDFCFECSDGIDNDGDGDTDYPRDRYCVNARDHTESFTVVAFVTSTLHSGNLGGVSGSDTWCQARADTADLHGTFKAWIAIDSSDSPDVRFTHYSVPIALTNGITIADDWADLTDGALSSPISVDESQIPGYDSQVWTNVGTDGRNAGSNRHCDSWTNSVQPLWRGGIGFSIKSDAWWTEFIDTAFCVEYKRLYCFEQEPI